MQFARKLPHLAPMRLVIRSPLTILSVIGLAASVAAFFWDVWPGDSPGVALLHPISNTYLALPIQAVNIIGSDSGRIALLLIMIIALLVKRRPRTAIALTVIIGAELTIVGLLKWIIERPRPEISGNIGAVLPLATDSFPSGHTAFTVAFFGCLAYLCMLYWPPTNLRRKLFVPFILLPIILAGPARVMSGDHWPSDIIGSYIIALIAIKVFTLAHKRYEIPETTEGIATGLTKDSQESNKI